eukprot:TRINITY_DN48117_c0_g1_i1.p1 TRINITY_DN48117_c0_g1~~TRINITY_DN48117_c0_g1_i1.p1  ORF type:complete len:412 (-),score=44.65 TRINITY_DN48117_c0_g1_i1:123-1301(-)
MTASDMSLLGHEDPDYRPLAHSEPSELRPKNRWTVAKYGAAFAMFGLALAGTMLLAAPSDTQASVEASATREFVTVLNEAAGEQEGPAKLKPIVMMHGMLQSEIYFRKSVEWIKRNHPSTEVFVLDVLDGDESLGPLWAQLAVFTGQMTELRSKHKHAFAQGYNLVCHSMGALLCRAFCQLEAGHGVQALVAVAGPQMGVYGDTWLRATSKLGPLKQFDIPVDVKIPFIGSIGLDLQHLFHNVAYTDLAQKDSAVANLWADPLHWKDYLSESLFLPIINGVAPDTVPDPSMKENFASLTKAVFLVGSFAGKESDDAVGLEPWQSGIFSFYAPGSETTFVPMTDREEFLSDTFGLRTLHETGRLHVQAVDGVRHHDWFGQQLIFEKHILPHLV